jgi:hypothetical protein
MTNQEIRLSVDDIYYKISQLKENLKAIRAECKHEKKVEGVNFEMVIHNCLICETCGESFPLPYDYYKNSSCKRGNRGKNHNKSQVTD